MQYKMVLSLSQKLHPLIYPSQFVHDIIESGKCGKKEKKLQQFEYLKKKALFRWNKKLFIVFEGLSLVKKWTAVDRSFNKASSLPKMFEGLFIEN